MGVFQIFLDKNGQFRWRMMTVNGEVLAVSEGHPTKDLCLYAMETMRRLAERSTIDDLTAKAR
ncbi:MAG: YegP family protein [Isosphaeraceae bacterium]